MYDITNISILNRNKSIKCNLNSLIEKCKKIHGDKYDYSHFLF